MYCTPEHWPGTAMKTRVTTALTAILWVIPAFADQPASASADESVAALLNCGDGLPGQTPEDLRVDEAQLGTEGALEALERITGIVEQIQLYDPAVDEKRCPFPDCIAGVPWEMANMALPNALIDVKGALLRLDAANQARRMKAEPGTENRGGFEKAKQRYCEFLSGTAVVD